MKRKFDEKEFEKAIRKPNGWNDVKDPVAEIRRMRGEDAPTAKARLATTLTEIWEMASDLSHLAADEEGRVCHKSSVLVLAQMIVEWSVVAESILKNEMADA